MSAFSWYLRQYACALAACYGQCAQMPELLVVLKGVESLLPGETQGTFRARQHRRVISRRILKRRGSLHSQIHINLVELFAYVWKYRDG
jgi:hypothetical protein